jgi:hypothetical protein
MCADFARRRRLSATVFWQTTRSSREKLRRGITLFDLQHDFRQFLNRLPLLGLLALSKAEIQLSPASTPANREKTCQRKVECPVFGYLEMSASKVSARDDREADCN